MSIQWIIGLLKKFNVDKKKLELWSDDMSVSFEVRIWKLCSYMHLVNYDEFLYMNDLVDV